MYGGVLVKNLKIREGEMQRAKQMEGRLVMCLGNAPLGLGLEKAIYLYLFFFLSVGLDEPVRFGSVRFNRFQIFKTETKPNWIFFVIF
jgi:hypothetical protein